MANGGGGANVWNFATAGAQGLFGMWDNRWNRKQTRENVDKTIAANKAEAELAYQRQMDMQQYMNWYNSPEQQMQRYKDAGLNPHLIYGQGTPGNMTSAPSYNPPDVKYEYAPNRTGAALSSMLPVLMQVGSWVQDMRLKDADLRNKELGGDKTSQLIEYLKQANPKLLQEMDNKLEMFPDKFNIQQFISGQMYTKLADMEQEFRYKYGEPLFQKFGSFSRSGDMPKIEGEKRIEFMKKYAEAKIKDAQASWTDFSITNPQAIIQLVMSSVLGMAGNAVKAPARSRSTAEKVKNSAPRYNSPTSWRNLGY